LTREVGPFYGGVGRPLLVWRLSESSRLFPVVSGPRAESVLASELVTNSVRHSGSAVPGGVVTVTVAAGDEVVRVEVTDRCGERRPGPAVAACPRGPAGDLPGLRELPGPGGGGGLPCCGLPPGDSHNHEMGVRSKIRLPLTEARDSGH
jgi:hypothetical protein